MAKLLTQDEAAHLARLHDRAEVLARLAWVVSETAAQVVEEIGHMDARVAVRARLEAQAREAVEEDRKTRRR